MKDICLIREDLTAAPIKLCVGEVVIGRGPLLECIDKRVSRNHGLLKLSDDGNILLVATHTNPFYVTSGNKEKEVISQGKSITLQCGDKFSLLPDSYCYRVIFSDDKTITNESITEEEEKINHSASATENDKTWCETLDEKEDDETTSHKTIGTKLYHALEKNEIVEKKTSSLLVRKRVLPSWMLEDVGTATPKKTKNIEPKAKRKETVPNAEVKKKQTQEQFMEEPDPSANTNEEYHLECTGTGGKVQNTRKLHSISDDEQSNSDTSNCIQEAVEKAKQHISDSEQSDNEQLNDEQQENTGSAETPGDQQQNPSSSSDTTQPKSPNVTKKNREPCKYGAACYRKNPQHKEEFCHPGDEDFEDKPECPYGISCYRKNPLHTQSFKHTTIAVKKKAQRQTKKKKKDESDYESDEDSYDEEDPFINNASSDDYEPTDSESGSESVSDGEEEGGTRRMLKEAKRFVKKR